MVFIAVRVNHESKSIDIMPCSVEGDTYTWLSDFIGNTMDCVEKDINGQVVDVWCDDEFLFANPLVPTLAFDDGSVICGNAVIASCDKDGNTIGLSKKQFDVVRRWLLKDNDVNLGKFIEGQRRREV